MMKYLPIFTELFQSDSYLFLLLGIFIAILTKNDKNTIYYLIPAYLACEVICYLSTNYLLEFISLFLGTIILGMILGYIIKSIYLKLTNKA